ncbi:hypothetical protein AB0B13_05930 [Streptomyces sp. NPDC042898]|uniref:DUF7919 family protein n=1 Tax=Streptomyces sp. NPDC042898 TaxID=3154334 RepID=UPI0033F7A946
MEYLDLSDYEYTPSIVPMLNVGWLGGKHGIPQHGKHPMLAEAVPLLTGRHSRVSRVALGWHDCEFCEAGARIEGNGEFVYYARNGSTYCAPVMLIHYVESHGYCPPTEFIDAILDERDLDWDSRADTLDAAIRSESEDFEARCEAIIDIANWPDARSVDALIHAAHDEELVDVSGEDIGRSLKDVLRGLNSESADTVLAGLPSRVKDGYEGVLDGFRYLR